ncbi:Pr6Pr family membrane protein [Variovorax boronicumulans]|uniref:Pr6Pr family membrane protein n=1 Tax=Variovorax boronicumulans TaxID=436515 RepID=UPI001C56B566
MRVNIWNGLRLALALLTLAAIGRQLAIHLALGFPALNFFSYFTNLSNLFAAVVLCGVAWRASSGREPRPAADLLRAMAVVDMVVVGIVFALLLRDVDLGALRPWINVLLHGVMPCAMLIDWLRVPPVRPLGVHAWWLCQAVPAAYLAYVLLRGAATGWYPYPFLVPAKVGGYGGVALYAVGIALTFALVGWAVLALGNRRARTLA